MEDFTKPPGKLSPYEIANDTIRNNEINVFAIKRDLDKLIKGKKSLRLFQMSFFVLCVAVFFFIPRYCLSLFKIELDYTTWGLILIVQWLAFIMYGESMIDKNEVYSNIKKWLDFRIEVCRIIISRLEK